MFNFIGVQNLSQCPLQPSLTCFYLLNELSFFFFQKIHLNLYEMLQKMVATVLSGLHHEKRTLHFYNYVWTHLFFVQLMHESLTEDLLIKLNSTEKHQSHPHIIINATSSPHSPESLTQLRSLNLQTQI